MAADDRPGVGPWQGPWPDDARYDPALLAEGDHRNVADRYRYWSVEAIREELRARAHPFHVAIENWQHDLNIGTVVRAANAVAAACVHIVGRRRWNRRGAMMTEAYLQLHHHADPADLVTWTADRALPLLGVDNLPGAVDLFTADLPRACVMVFGQEGPGLSQALRRRVDLVLSIPQFGSTRSLNAGVASGIAMGEWIRRHREGG